MNHEPYTVHKTVEKLKSQAFFEVHIHVFICKFDNVQSYSIVLIYCILYLCNFCLLYTSPSPRDQRGSRMPSSA